MFFTLIVLSDQGYIHCTRAIEIIFFYYNANFLLSCVKRLVVSATINCVIRYLRGPRFDSRLGFILFYLFIYLKHY